MPVPIHPPGSFKRYVALITQTGTAAPTALELQNEIGTITWTRITAGQYQGQKTDEFPNEKTAIHAPQQQNNGGSTLLFKAASNTVALQTSVGGAFLDDLLTNTRIEINIYN